MEVLLIAGIAFVGIGLYFIRSYLYGLKEGVKAHRRGEIRVAPRGTRGRVYRKKDEAGSALPAKTEPKATIYMKITRADGSVEYRESPAQVTFIPDSE